MEGGNVAGNARRDLDKKSDRRVSTKENFREIPETEKRKQLKMVPRLEE